MAQPTVVPAAQSSVTKLSTEPSSSTMSKLLEKFYTNSNKLAFTTDAIKKTQQYEFEIKFNTRRTAKYITRGDFNNVVRRLKLCKYTLQKDEGEEMLRISPLTKSKSSHQMRVEINGRKAIMDYCNNPEDIILKSSENIKVVDKERVDQVDFPKYDCVATLSLETVVDELPSELQDFQNISKHFRYMKRVTMLPPQSVGKYHKVDLTVVKSGDGKNLKKSPLFNEDDDRNVTYEIEVEYSALLPGFKYPGGNRAEEMKSNILQEFQKVMSFILSGLQQSVFPISNAEQGQVLQEYADLVGYTSPTFYGPKPKALYYDQLHKIVEIYPYTVTEKADGDRKLLFINAKGRMYFITMQMKVQFTGVQVSNTDLYRTLLDGEHVTRRKVQDAADNDPFNLYLIFDIYVRKGIQVTSYPLMTCDAAKESRYELFTNVASQLNREQKMSSSLKIRAKEFHQFNPDDNTISAMAQLVLKTEFDYETDGLIFTPECVAVNGNPKNTQVSTNATWEYCFKWKEVETVDFKVKWNEPTKVYQKVTLSLNDSTSLPAILTLNAQDKLVVEDGNEIINSGDIVEFRYNNDVEVQKEKRWIPYRIRTDKSKPNGRKVYEDMINNKDNTISRKYFTDGSMDCSEDYFKRADDDKKIMTQLRRFHNCIKDKLIQAATILCPKEKGKNHITLIDLAVGKANDISKWKKNHITYVLGIDIVPDNITNNYLTDSDVTPPSSLEKVILLKGDASKPLRYASDDNSFSDDKEDQQKVREVFADDAARNGFQIVSVQFALHYMFKDESTLHGFMRNLQEVTVPGGIFIGTCFDGTAVDTFLTTKSGSNSPVDVHIQDPIENSDIFWIHPTYDRFHGLVGAATVGKEINVFMKSIGNAHKEYLVNFEYLTRLLQDYGFDSITTEEFKKVKLPEDHTFKRMMMQFKKVNLSEEEKSISFLNRFFVYRKTRELTKDQLDDLDIKVRLSPKRKSTDQSSSDSASSSASSSSSSSSSSSASGTAFKRQAVPKFDQAITKQSEKVTLTAIEPKK